LLSYVFAVLCIVPGRAPAVTAGAYETVLHDTNGQKQIKLYWQVIEIFLVRNCTVSSFLAVHCVHDMFHFVFILYIYVHGQFV